MAEKLAERVADDQQLFAAARADLGRRLRQARAKSELTQSQVGEALGLGGDSSPHVPVSNWEQGKDLPTTLNLIGCAEVYRVSLDWLVFGMKGKIEDRIQRLPDGLRDGVLQQIMTALEGAEALAKRHPALFGDKAVQDDDARLTSWSAAAKIAKMRPTKRASKNSKRRSASQ